LQAPCTPSIGPPRAVTTRTGDKRVTNLLELVYGGGVVLVLGQPILFVMVFRRGFRGWGGGLSRLLLV